MSNCYEFFADAQQHISKLLPYTLEQNDFLIDRMMPRLQAGSEIYGRAEMWASMSVDLKTLFLRDACMRWPLSAEHPNGFDKTRLREYLERYEALPADYLEHFFLLIFSQTMEAFSACCIPTAVQQITSSYNAVSEVAA